MGTNFGTLDFSTSFKPTSAFPLDARAYFEDFAEAQQAAATAKPAGDTTTRYYFGQIICVVTNANETTATAKLYNIVPKDTGGNVVGELVEVGTGASANVEIDTAQFTRIDGKLSLVDFAAAVEGAQLLKRGDTLVWEKPDTSTVTGLATNLQTLEGKVTALEEKMATRLTKEVVAKLPKVSDAKEDVIYMVKADGAQGEDVYKEYVLMSGVLTCIGDTSTDLSGVIKGVQINSVDLVADGDQKVNIPTATTDILGVVKLSAEVTAVDGALSIAEVNVNKLSQTDGDILILNGGDSTN